MPPTCPAPPSRAITVTCVTCATCVYVTCATPRDPRCRGPARATHFPHVTGVSRFPGGGLPRARARQAPAHPRGENPATADGGSDKVSNCAADHHDDRAPASDLGFLLHKHPGRAQSFDVSVGSAHVFYPEAATRGHGGAAARGRPGRPGARPQGPGRRGLRARPVRQRPPVRGVEHARGGDRGGLPHRDDRPLRQPPGAGRHGDAARAARAGAACRGGPDLARRVFEPLGWQVEAAAAPLDPAFPGWGDSRYLDVRLTGDAAAGRRAEPPLRAAAGARRRQALLGQPDEVDKLIRAGEGWLAAHPEKELITRRYLAHRGELTRRRARPAGRGRRRGAGGARQRDRRARGRDRAPTSRCRSPSSAGGPCCRSARPARTRVGDLGCGEGVLVRDLLADHAIERVVATDVSARALQIAARRLRLDRMSEPPASGCGSSSPR